MRFTAAVLALGSFISVAFAGLEDAKYAKVLSGSNFDQLIAEPEVGTLTAFFAPWCGHCKNLEPTWTKVAHAFENDPKCNVAILDADNSSNKPISSRYGVRGFPTIKFLPSKGQEAIDYALPRTEQAFISFLNEQCGTQRAPGGGLTALAGRLPSFDKLAQNFLDAGKSTKDELLSQAKKLAADVNDQAAAIYVRVFEKIYGDESYVQKELERIQKLLSKKSTLASQKVDGLQVKQNILQAFESSKEKAEDVKEKVKEEL